MSDPFQIVFTPVSSAEMSALPQLLQLEVLNEFNVLSPDFLKEKPDLFGVIKKGDRHLYRYRAKDYRIYFEQTPKGLLIHRVLDKNSLKDFLFRSQFPVTEDEELAKNASFWKMIDSHHSDRDKH